MIYQISYILYKIFDIINKITILCKTRILYIIKDIYYRNEISDILYKISYILYKISYFLYKISVMINKISYLIPHI